MRHINFDLTIHVQDKDCDEAVEAMRDYVTDIIDRFNFFESYAFKVRTEDQP